MPAPDLAALVSNRTMSPAMAAVLATAAEERRSFIVVAIPRLAGKTTVMQATLAWAPHGTPLHMLSTDRGPTLGIPDQGDGGYLVVSEVAQTPFPDYLWGEPVRRTFQTLQRGFSLATALHADGLESAFDLITSANQVPDEDAARIELLVYIRSLGDWREPTRRVVEAMYEIETVVHGRPQARLLHRWLEAEDRFVAIDAPLRIGSVGDGLEQHAREFGRLADI